MIEHRPLLIIIAGPNGSGKTTITSRILKHEWLEDCEYINPDDIAQNTFGDWNSEESVLKAAQLAKELREKHLKNKCSMIFESVFSTEEKVQFVKKAVESGFFVRIFFVATENPIINASRVARRVLNGGHDVPIKKIISRYAKSIGNAFEVAHIVDRMYVYDNTIENVDARPLFRLTKGKLAKQYTTDIPIWATPLLESCK